MTAADDGGALPAELAADLAAGPPRLPSAWDFDGTLSPIVPARPLEGVGELSGPLAARFAAWHWSPAARPTTWPPTLRRPGVRYLGLYELEEIRDGQVWVDPRLEAGRPPWPRPTRIYGSSGRDRRPPRSPP